MNLQIRLSGTLSFLCNQFNKTNFKGLLRTTLVYIQSNHFFGNKAKYKHRHGTNIEIFRQQMFISPPALGKLSNRKSNETWELVQSVDDPPPPNSSMKIMCK